MRSSVRGTIVRVDDPWGLDDPPAAVATGPLPPRLAALASLTGRVPYDGAPRPEELPEVAALAERGWLPLGDDLDLACLPAVWPREHRCWVPDRLPKVYVGDGWVQPWTEDDLKDIASDYRHMVTACGLLPRPPGRLWLVRSPWPEVTAREVLDAVYLRLAERDLSDEGENVTEVAREVLGWTGERVRTYLR